MLQTETLEIDTITGQIGGMLKGSLDIVRDVDTIFKCRLPDLGIHLFLSLKQNSASHLAFYLLFNIRERWRIQGILPKS